MASSEYLLLVNNALKSHILSLDEKAKDRLREKLDFLANGLWDSGIRIKKLRGVSRKVVFEARLSRSRRLLFTLGRADGRRAAYLWGIVEHDEVSRKAAQLIPENAPFLQFTAAEEESHPDISIDELSPDYYSQESIEEKVAEDYGPQKWFVLSDQEWRRLMLSGAADDIETYLYLSREQAEILAGDPPVLISGTAGSGKTTLSVYYLFREPFLHRKRLFLTYSPFLKRFSERIYQGLVKNSPLEGADASGAGAAQAESPRAEGPPGSPASPSAGPDFLTFGELLERILAPDRDAPRLSAGLGDFQRIYANHKLSRKYDSELVWEEVRSIIKGAKPMISLGRLQKLITDFSGGEVGRNGISELQDTLLGLKTFEFAAKIERAIEHKTDFKDYDDFVKRLAALAGARPSDRNALEFLLHEILRIVEKRIHRLATPLLTFQEYSSLGRKRAPNFLYDREEIYSIAEYYQQRLEEEGLVDEIDLCRRAIDRINVDGETHRYDLVVCDEVQDFADVQLSLIFRLADPFWSVVLAGDTKQIINPSGFRWEEAKDKFYERAVPVPQVHNLSLNFRCVGSIVRMANALLELKRKLVGLSGSELREDWKFNGKPPCLVSGVSDREILERIRLTGAGRIVLTRSEREQRTVKKALGTELVFTIYQAKGLEFDTVLLWKFTRDPRGSVIWRRLAAGQPFDQSHEPHIRHELNLLYVAITRARNTLLIYEGERPSDVWSIEALADCLYVTAEKEAVASLWQRISTPEEWKSQGDYFFEREYYPAAWECYRNAGHGELAEKAEAFVLRQKGRLDRAADLLEKHGYTREAAESAEGCGRFEKACELWERLGEARRARVCRTRLYEDRKEYGKAAEEWQRLGEKERALNAWRKAGDDEQIAELYAADRNYAKAAEYYERARVYRKAAASHRKLKNHGKAAELYERAGDWESAAAAYKKLKNTAKLLACYERLEDHYAAALVCEKAKDIGGAVAYFERCAGSSREARQKLTQEAAGLLKARKLKQAAVRYSALGRYQKSAPLFERAKKTEWAAADYRRLGAHQKAAECLARLKKHHEAVLEMEKAEDADRWDWMEEQLRKYAYRGRRPTWFSNPVDPERGNELLAEATAKFEEGKYDSALIRYKAIDFGEGAATAYGRLDRDDEALAYLFDNRMIKQVATFIDARGDELEVSADLVDRLIHQNPYTWYGRGKEREEALIRVLRCVVRKHLEVFRPLIELYVYSLEHLSVLSARGPEGLADLILEARLYNVVFDTAHWISWRPEKLDENERSFLEKVKETGESREDPDLLACYRYVFDREAYEDSLERLTMDRWNYVLFGHSPARYREAVELILREKESIPDAVAEAVRICHVHKEHEWAARIYEAEGDYKEAGRNYRDAGMLEEALRCFIEAGDEPNTARTYEKLGRLEEALQVWKKRGAKREIARVQKKLDARQRDTDQLKLF